MYDALGPARNLAVADFLEDNPLLRLFVWPHRPMLGLTASLTGWCLLLLGVNAADHTLVIPGPDVGYLEDFAMLGLVATAWCSMAAAISLLGGVRKLVLTLCLAEPCGIPGWQAGAQCSGSDTDDPLFGRLERALDTVALRSPRGRCGNLVVLGFMAVLVYVFEVHIPFFLPQPIRAWGLAPLDYPIAYAGALLWCLFVFVIIIGNVLWYAASAAVLLFPLVHQFIVHGRIKVIPIAPDGKAGLASLGTVSLSLTLILGSGIPFLLMWLVVYGVDMPLMAGVALYTMALVGGFFLPLQSVHRDMRRARERELERLALVFKTEYDRLPTLSELREGLSGERQEALRHETAHLSRLDQLYRRAEAMPVWPFDTGTLGQSFALMVAPLLVFLVQLFSQDAITRLLRGGK